MLVPRCPDNTFIYKQQDTIPLRLENYSVLKETTTSHSSKYEDSLLGYCAM
jgi:hypothetical protein